jgi:hypothetical protein
MSSVNEARFKNTILAILTARPGLGSVQLRKALIIADALHFSLFGESFTGAKYIKFPYGPVPDRDAFNLLNRMYFEENLIDIIEEPEGPMTKNSYFALQSPDTGVFTEEEDKIIRFAANVALKYSASKLSDMTHDEVFNKTAMRGEIPLDRVCTMTITGRFDTPDFTEEEKFNLMKVLSSNEARHFSFV